MKNILIYSEKENLELQNILLDNFECDVRFKNIKEFKDSHVFNPSLIIFDYPLNIVKEYATLSKLPVPALVIADSIDNTLTLRGSYFDFICKPLNKRELTLRITNLLAIKELKELITQVTTTDELTGLHNRKYLQDRIDAELSRARRYNTKISCVLFDIDFFKVVNDMYGYDWGDVLLKRIAEMLKNLIRKEDILTRYGDEEFLLLLPNTPEENAFIFAERFRRDIEKMEFIPAGETEKHAITISGGIASYPFMEEVDENANTLIRYSEHALYNAKKRGKNKIVQFSQMNLDY